ncbi:hypothetical protein [Arthrobacter sp. CAN_C5]|uniref:hypothetical protein n=1 Tax=Arthrobacter sp. CAN_C5 TaxID=2760706 RepID=UPI001AEA487D|nr:hypothetical protein [Arthrobacter sp. CAN_C5]MBP2216731.1 hypothetical protein [Arthrobacter sp. CAN_C5]
MTDTPSPISSGSPDSPDSPDSADSPDEVQLPDPKETEVDEAVMDESADNPALDVGQVTTSVDEENEDSDPRQV